MLGKIKQAAQKYGAYLLAIAGNTASGYVFGDAMLCSFKGDVLPATYNGLFALSGMVITEGLEYKITNYKHIAPTLMPPALCGASLRALQKILTGV